MNPYDDRSVFLSILIDASVSMAPYAGDVSSGHRLMLDTLRQSEKAHTQQQRCCLRHD